MASIARKDFLLFNRAVSNRVKSLQNLFRLHPTKQRRYTDAEAKQLFRELQTRRKIVGTERLRDYTAKRFTLNARQAKAYRELKNVYLKPYAQTVIKLQRPIPTSGNARLTERNKWLNQLKRIKAPRSILNQIKRRIDAIPLRRRTENLRGEIYKIREKATGRIYIGQTVRGTMGRFQQHLTSKSASPFDKYLRKQGASAFTVSVIARTRNLDRLNALEKSNIAKYHATNPAKGFNVKKAATFSKVVVPTRGKKTINVKSMTNRARKR